MLCDRIKVVEKRKERMKVEFVYLLRVEMMERCFKVSLNLIIFLIKENVFNNSLLFCRLVGIFSKVVRCLFLLLLSEIYKKIRKLLGGFLRGKKIKGIRIIGSNNIMFFLWFY